MSGVVSKKFLDTDDIGIGPDTGRDSFAFQILASILRRRDSTKIGKRLVRDNNASIRTSGVV